VAHFVKLLPWSADKPSFHPTLRMLDFLTKLSFKSTLLFGGLHHMENASLFKAIYYLFGFIQMNGGCGVA
jgi:hypothetical protein